MDDLCLHSSNIKTIFNTLANLVKSGKRYRLIIKIWREKRTIDQNSLSHMWYTDIAEQANEIIWFKFEGLKFKLANNTTYTPDFVVMNKDGLIELHEVKGFWMDDARVKIKVAADMYPFKFLAIKKKAKKLGGGWEIEEF